MSVKIQLLKSALLWNEDMKSWKWLTDKVCSVVEWGQDGLLRDLGAAAVAVGIVLGRGGASGQAQRGK